MRNYRDLSTIALIILFGVFLQLLFVSAELKETPERAAVSFAKAYYRLDPDMRERICQKLLEDGDPVDDLIHGATVEARQRGFNPSYMKSQLFRVRTTVLAQDTETAQIRLTCERKKAIHPTFAYFAKMWHIGETYHEDAVIELILEDGKWKVCNESAFERL